MISSIQLRFLGFILVFSFAFKVSTTFLNQLVKIICGDYVLINLTHSMLSVVSY